MYLKPRSAISQLYHGEQF